MQSCTANENCDAITGEVFIISPVMAKDGIFFDRREQLKTIEAKLHYDADANECDSEKSNNANTSIVLIEGLATVIFSATNRFVSQSLCRFDITVQTK